MFKKMSNIFPGYGLKPRTKKKSEMRDGTNQLMYSSRIILNCKMRKRSQALTEQTT